MKIVSGKKMGEIDHEAMTRFAIPGLILMENAGLQVVRCIQKLRPRRDEGKVAIFCGKGNNGGDGFVIARHLRRLGYTVETWAMGHPSEYSGDAAVNHNILLKDGYEVYWIKEKDPLPFIDNLKRADLIVDALLGTGIQRPVSETFAKVIAAINKTESTVIAVDIPSGISADSGEVMGTAVKAHYTVTFALPKKGLLLFPGAEFAGKVLVADIGIPAELTSSADIKENLVTAYLVQAHLPPRSVEGHKGTSGRALLLAGSPGMTGAAVLAAEAALRGGAGLVYAGTAAELRPVLEAKLKEVIVLGFAGDGKGHLTAAAASDILEHAGRCQALGFGPGLKVDRETLHLLKSLAAEVSAPIVVDAGGLSALTLARGDYGFLKQGKATFILTPHPGEMAKMLGRKTEDVQKDRWEQAQKYSREWNVVLVLKGAHTVIALPDGEIYINPTGNPVLSSAGTGDLLTGLITGLAGQGLSPAKAAICGAYLHGLAADMLVKHSGERGFKAGDILEFFPRALNETAKLPPPKPGEPYCIRPCG